MLVLVSCSKVTESDLTRACTKIGNTPKYLAPSVFADEYYKLEDKAGVKVSASAISLKYILKSIELTVIGGQSFQEACTSVLREKFMGIEPEPEPDNSPPEYDEKDEATLKKEREELDKKRGEILSVAQTTNLFCPRIKVGNHDGDVDHHWIAAQLYKVDGILELASVYAYSPKNAIESYCQDFAAYACSSVYVERDPSEYKYKSLSEQCDLGNLPFCERVGKSIVWAKGGFPKYGSTDLKSSNDSYLVGADVYRGGIRINRKNLEAQWSYYFPDGKPREKDAIYKCEILSKKEFTEKALEPIQSRFNEVVAEETQKLSEIEEVEEIQKEIESAPEENQI